MAHNTYELEVRAVCPIHVGLIDFYQVTVRSESLIQVEKILEFFTTFQDKQIYQEDLTSRAAVALGAQVQTVGIHSGVKVTCVAP